MKPATAARLRISALVVVALLVQTTLASDFRLFGVVPDLMLLVAICAGLTGGPEAGAFVGFGAGLLVDLSLTATPLGLSALSWCLVGWGVGTVRANVLPETRSVLPAIAFVATAGGIVVFLVIGDLIGQSQLIELGRSYLIRATLVESLWNGLLAIPVAFVYERAAHGSAGATELRRSDALANA